MPSSHSRTVDVIVVGAGAAGLTAALSAKSAGAKEVVVLEKTEKLGGSTSFSAGSIWIPNNSHQKRAEINDSRNDAMKYLRRVVLGQASDALLETFLDFAPTTITFLESYAGVQFSLRKGFPDYHPEWEGGRKSGRTLEPMPFSLSSLEKELSKSIRTSPHYPPIMQSEADEWALTGWKSNVVVQRMNEGVVTMGSAFVAALVKGCVDHDVELSRNSRVTRLTRENGRVVGVEVSHNTTEEPMILGSRNCVVLSSGGFAWNQEMKRHYLRGPAVASATPPGDEGDGILLGSEIGAALRNMNEAWWSPVIQIPGELYEGKQSSRMLVAERAKPGSILVNKGGRRFCNEAGNYHDIAKTFHNFDPYTYDFPNVPAYLIFDDRFRKSYFIGPLLPGSPPPEWIRVGNTVKELAEQIGIDSVTLSNTVERFNQFAREGNDPDFHRGESRYDVGDGDPKAQYPCLAPLDTAPLHALTVLPGDIGTKGGLATNERAQVLDVRGETIKGLRAAGNVAASPMGGGYPGGGGTLGPAITFGYIAGNNAARDRSRDE